MSRRTIPPRLRAESAPVVATPDFINKLRSKIGNDLLEVPTAGGVLQDAEGRVLLMQQTEGGLWSLPGGMIEPRESPSDAVVREVYEETGVFMRILGIIGVFGGPEFVVTYANGDQISYVCTAYLGERISGEARVVGDETADIGWFLPDEIASLACSSIVAPVINALASYKGSAWFEPPTWKPAPN